MIFSFFHRMLHKKVLVLCALPLVQSKAESLYRLQKSDFLVSIGEECSASSFSDIWNHYGQSASQLGYLLKSYQKAGATVLTDFSVGDLRNISGYDAVILMAHHVRDCDAVELCGTQVPTSAIVQAIPFDYQGVMDISSCFSAAFQLEIKMHAPQCRIIATETATALRVRLVIYEELLERIKRVDEDYLESFRTVVKTLIASVPQLSVSSFDSIKDDTPRIMLGGKQKSTVFAPAKARKGDTFMVQIYLHKEEESEAVELQARMIDDDATQRNTKTLSIKLKKGDKVDISLRAPNGTKDDFNISGTRRSVEWQNEPVSVEFSVSVCMQTTQSAFIGNVMLAVNKLLVGSMMFKTEIVQAATDSHSCASFEILPYDIDKEKQEMREMLLSRVRARLSCDLTESEKKMCEHCLQILSESPNHNNPIPRVFISSTSDMALYRKVIEERVRACEMFPDMYELWGQGNDYPRDMCCRHVLQSDYFVSILGSAYGYVEPIWDKSMTEIEYRVAKSAGIPILIYILNDNNEPESRQKAFLDEVKTQRLVGIFRDTMSLALMSNSELLTLKNTKQ